MCKMCFIGGIYVEFIEIVDGKGKNWEEKLKEFYFVYYFVKLCKFIVKIKILIFFVLLSFSKKNKNLRKQN